MKTIDSSARIALKKAFFEIPDGPDGDRERGRLYEPYLKDYGENFKIASQAFIFNPNGLVVGDHVYIGFNSYLGQGDIFLDSEVLIGNFVSLTASNHLIKDDSFRFGGFKSEPIHIGRGSWLGAQSSILAGVKLPNTTLVASGAIVTKSINEPGMVLGGCPAKIISSVKKFKEKYGI